MSVSDDYPNAELAQTARPATGFPDDVRARLDADAALVLARYPEPRSALLPLLHLVQSEEGYVSPRGIEFCAQLLGLTTAEVAGVATFYTQYKRRPNGEYTVGVCTNTLCAVMGGDAIFDSLSRHLDVGHDETTEDGKITLERVECNAACDYAPVMMVNWEFFDNQTPQSARQVVDQLREGIPVQPSRGASSVCSFKQMSRVLAGFSDGRADEGPGAGPSSLVGLELAKERGWSAPSADGDERTGGGQQDAPARQRTDTEVAAEHVASPSAPSSSDAAVAPGQGGAAPAGDDEATPRNERLPEGDSGHDDTNVAEGDALSDHTGDERKGEEA
ncbi:MAG TPA: NADH-quinone oxidoreductase subunit NuoE [Actinomycetales bacterium]|nr:NADH-quinone oxidoreductase subunit NuoE [Actinomycetales bacterium]